MLVFQVDDMTLFDAAVAIVKAVKAIDEEACVYVNMARRAVEITPASSGATLLSDAIINAGFTPVLMPTGYVLPGLGRPLARIPFEGIDHDFSP